MNSPKAPNVVPCVHSFIRKITCPLDKLCRAGPLERKNNIVTLGIPEASTECRCLRIEFGYGCIFDPKASSEAAHYRLFVIMLMQCGRNLFGGFRPYSGLYNFSWLGNRGVHRRFRWSFLQ